MLRNLRPSLLSSRSQPYHSIVRPESQPDPASFPTARVNGERTTSPGRVRIGHLPRNLEHTYDCRPESRSSRRLCQRSYRWPCSSTQRHQRKSPSYSGQQDTASANERSDRSRWPSSSPSPGLFQPSLDRRGRLASFFKRLKNSFPFRSTMSSS